MSKYIIQRYRNPTMCVCVCMCIDTFVDGDDDTRIPWQEEDDYFKKKKKN